MCLVLDGLGAKVSGYALPQARNSLFRTARLDRVVRHADGDIRDLRALDRFARKARPRVIFHLAAQALVRPAYRDPKATFDTNVGGSVNVLEVCRRLPGIEALVYVTSDKCYRDRGLARGYSEDDELGGRDPYSASKAAAEVVFASYREVLFPKNLGAASARAGNVIGGGDWAEDRLVPDLARAALARKPLTLRHPGSVRPWQHVLDPVSGYLLLGAHLLTAPARYSGSWNFGPDARGARTVLDLVREFGRVWGTAPARKVSRSPEPETRFLRLDAAKARRLLGWRPRWAFSRAVRESAAWYKAAGAGAGARELCRRQIADYFGERS